MIIQLEKNIEAAQYQNLTQKLESINYQYTKVKTQFQEYLVAIGKQEFDIRSIGVLDGVQDLHRVSDNYKLVSSKWKVQDTIIDLGDGVKIGGGLISHLVTEIEITCLPKDLPEYIEVDLAELELGETIQMSEITLPKGITSVALSHGEDHDMGVVTCAKPRGSDEDDEAEATAETEATTEEAAGE